MRITRSLRYIFHSKHIQIPSSLIPHQGRYESTHASLSNDSFHRELGLSWKAYHGQLLVLLTWLATFNLELLAIVANNILSPHCFVAIRFTKDESTLSTLTPKVKSFIGNNHYSEEFTTYCWLPTPPRASASAFVSQVAKVLRYLGRWDFMLHSVNHNVNSNWNECTSETSEESNLNILNTLYARRDTRHCYFKLQVWGSSSD